MKLPQEISNHLELPLIVAPMFLVSGIDLTMASCKSGVIGSFPCTNARPIEQLDEWMGRLNKELAEYQLQHPDKKVAPWAANMIVHSTYARFDEEIALVKKHQPKVVITALGSPARVVPDVKSYGGLVFADVNSVAFAKKAAKTGVDGLILVCSGAGGHTGLLSPFAFVDAVRQFWDGYILLAGSVSTGRAIRASQILGADLAYMGTRFIATQESAASEAYKQMLVSASSEDIVMTNAVTGVNANFMRQSLIDGGFDLENLNPAKVDFAHRGDPEKGKAWKDIWSAGHGVTLVDGIPSVAELVNTLKKEYSAST